MFRETFYLIIIKFLKYYKNKSKRVDFFDKIYINEIKGS